MPNIQTRTTEKRGERCWRGYLDMEYQPGNLPERSMAKRRTRM
jgi:hypothetical protein